MRIKAKTKQSLRLLYQQLFAADVAVVRPEQEEASSNIVIQPAFIGPTATVSIPSNATPLIPTTRKTCSMPLNSQP